MIKTGSGFTCGEEVRGKEGREQWKGGRET